MPGIILKAKKAAGIDDEELRQVLKKSVEQKGTLKKVLLIPPDITRSHSGAGKITAMYYNMLRKSCKVDIMPAIGMHMPMDEQELTAFFGDSIPKECFLVHNFRQDVEKIGEVPGKYIKEISEGIMDEPIDVEVNRRLLDKSYDLIISMGQVVPHVIVGMSNYSKNIFVGCGGKNMIDKTHMLGAFYGMERIMGRDNTPVRKVYDYAEQNFLKEIPIMYVLTVTTTDKEDIHIQGVFIGRDRDLYEHAVVLSQEKNICFVDKPVKKVVACLDAEEFKTVWVGNKAIYRTRMAIADGGELIVLAPGVRQFGENKESDVLIRKHGFAGREKVLELFEEDRELKANQSITAHLVHGSSDGRFKVTYAVDKLTKEEIEEVGFNYMPLKDAVEKYDPEVLKEGFNVLEDGEEVFFVGKPALGLWTDRNKFCCGEKTIL